MNTYIISEFEGFYPVGTCAVVVAETVHDALVQLAAELSARGLELDPDNPDCEILIVDPNRRGVKVILDGEY